MNLTEKLRAGHVRRWHIVAVSREQTVADHMHRVATITEEILTILGVFDWDNSLTLNAMRWAAIHDRHEYLLGDLPTPGKAAIRRHCALPTTDPIESAAASIDPEAEELRRCVAPGGECPLAGHIVKYADLLEAVNYLGVFGCGSHAREAWAGLRMDAVRAGGQILQALNRDHAKSAATPLLGLIDQLSEGTHWQ